MLLFVNTIVQVCDTAQPSIFDFFHEICNDIQNYQNINGEFEARHEKQGIHNVQCIINKRRNQCKTFSNSKIEDFHINADLPHIMVIFYFYFKEYPNIFSWK